MAERYEPMKELGSGNFGVARLVRDKKAKELFAVKYIERGKKIDEKVQREIINHRSLRHPNIIRFKEEICHRDLKLENTLLDGSRTPRLKICDFGYSKHVLERGKPQERTQIIKNLSGQVVKMSQHKFASNVIEKCLEYGNPKLRDFF